MDIFLGLLAIFLASLTQGFVGFGFSQVAIPIMALFMPTKSIIPLLLILGSLLNIIILLDNKKHVELKKIIILMITGTLGIPIGAYLLKILDAGIIKIFIGSMIIFSSATILSGKKIRIDREKLATIPIGFLSGILNGSITMSGPPIIIFFSNQGLSKDSFRANLVAYFLWLNIATIPVFVAGRLLELTDLRKSLILSPALFAGTIVGIIISKRVDNELFKKITLALLMVLGFSLIIGGILELNR